MRRDIKELIARNKHSYSVFTLVVYNQDKEPIGIGFYPTREEAQESLEFHHNYFGLSKDDLGEFTYKVKEVSLDKRDIIRLKETPEIKKLVKDELAVRRLIHITFPTEANEPLVLRGKELASKINRLVVGCVSHITSESLLRGLTGGFLHNHNPDTIPTQAFDDEWVGEEAEAAGRVTKKDWRK